MPVRYIPFGGRLIRGSDDPETGIDADLLIGVVDPANIPNIPASKLPAPRLLPPITAQFSTSDNGDLILYIHADGGGAWTRSGIDGGDGLQVRFDDSDDRLVVGIDARSKLQHIINSFVNGGWGVDTAAQTAEAATNTDPPGPTPKHTASAIVALTGWAADRRRIGFASGPTRMPLRIPLDQKPDVAAGRVRIAYGDFDTTDVAAVPVAEGDWVTDSGNYAYYSVLFAEGLGRDVDVRVERATPFEFSDDFLKVLNDQDRALLDSFTVGVWESTTTAELTGASTTPYGGPGDNYIAQASLPYAATQTIPSQSQAWNVGVRIPVGQKGNLRRYRIEVDPSGQDTTYQAITAHQHVADVGAWAYYNVAFRITGRAVDLSLELLSEHHIDTNNIQINFSELHDTPDSYVGAGGKAAVVKRDESGIEYVEFVQGVSGTSAALVFAPDPDNPRLWRGTVDQSAFDHLQVGAPVSGASAQAFHNSGSAGAYAMAKVNPTQTFTVHENNLVIVETDVGTGKYGDLVESVFLRRLPAIASKAGSLAATDRTYPIELGYDASGNRRVLHLFRYTDNTLGLAGELVTTAGARTVIAGSTPPTAFTADYALREVGGVAAAAAEQVDSRADKIRWAWGDFPSGTTPTAPFTFDGVLFGNTGPTWRFGNEVGTPAAGRERWYARAIASYTPGTGSDWGVQATVYPARLVRFSADEVPFTAAHYLSSPPPGTGSYYVQYYIGGGQWSDWRLVVGASEGWQQVAVADWHPESRNSQLWWDLADGWTRFDHLEGFRGELTLWNSFRDVRLDTAIFDLPVESMVARARGSTSSPPNEATIYGSCGLVHLERYGDHFGVISSLRTQDRGTDYSRGGFNVAVEYDSSVSGRTAFGFDRIRVFYPASYAPANALRYSLKFSILRR